MSYSYASAVTGVVTQATTAATINIPVPGFGDLLKFEIWDETQFGLASANTNMLSAYWYKDMPAGSAFVQNRTSGSAATITNNMVTTGGFTLVDPTASQFQAAKTGTAITNANPAVVTLTAHGYSVGDTVLLTNTTGMLQIAGSAFTITAVTTNSFTLGYLDASGFAAPATAVTARKLNFLSPFVPRRARITDVSQATALGVQSSTGTSSIITLAETNMLTVGQAVRIYVPTSFISAGSNPFVNAGIIGTASTSALIVAATITAINTADASGISNTITVNINSVGTTFAFPTSATAATGIQFPFVEPVGEAATTMAGLVNPQNLLDDSTQNTGTNIMQLGLNVYGVASDVIRWFAWRGAVTS
jgi:hypothetical protein